MRLEFGHRDLARLETDASYLMGLSPALVRCYRKVVNQIRQAPDERVFWNSRALNFERLQGQRAHQHSMRLNAQFRLIVELQGEGPKKTVRIVGVEDYH
jgi:proteic killer suppression protein